jgi:citrate lyase beta subunit
VPRTAARQAAALGFDGKWVIHPSQIAACNEVFSPSPDEVSAAEALVAAHNGATEHGAGASRHEGAMIDEASLRIAEGVIARARATEREVG